MCRQAAALCDRVVDLLPEGLERQMVDRVRAGLDEPFRIAVAGRVSSGKSTLVNALLHQRVAPTDVSECTRYVTTYRFGVPERLEVVHRDETRHTESLLQDGSLPRSPGGDGDISRLDVFLANDALRDLVLIDTPGLGSLEADRMTSTAALLGLDPDSRAAVADADALIFVLTASLRHEEAAVLHGFHEALVGSSASPLSALAVLNKADLVDGEEDTDPFETATELARRYAKALKGAVVAVHPLVSLLAETVTTGRFTERHVQELRKLATLSPAQRHSLLLSADRFLTADAPVSHAARRDLLDALALYGVAVGIAAVGEDRPSSVVVLERLRERSGFEHLHQEVLVRFAHDSDALKASGALAALERLAYGMVEPVASRARAELHDAIDAVRADGAMHRLEELRAANAITSGEVELPPHLSDSALRLISGGSTSARLGLEEGASADALMSAALTAVAGWKEFRNDGRASPTQQWVADVMTKTSERIWLEANRQPNGASP